MRPHQRAAATVLVGTLCMVQGIFGFVTPSPASMMIVASRTSPLSSFRVADGGGNCRGSVQNIAAASPARRKRQHQVAGAAAASMSVDGELSLTRRGMVGATLAAAILGGPAEGAEAKEDIMQRLESDIIPQLPADLSSNEDIPYPAWLQGTWVVTAKMTAWKAPLGNKFLGGITPDVNERSAAEAQSQVGSEAKYLLRFTAGEDGKVREDRLFNTRQRLDTYAGRKITRSVEYVPLDRGGKTKNLNTITYFKGGLVGKSFSTRRRWDTTPDGLVFTCDEGKRELYGKKCEQSVESKVCSPPITTDQEVLSQYRREGDAVLGRVRVVGYLNPNDKLFFDAKQKAVTVSDYNLVLRSVPPPPP